MRACRIPSAPKRSIIEKRSVFGRLEKSLGRWQVLLTGSGWTDFDELGPAVELKLVDLFEKSSDLPVSWTRNQVKYRVSFNPVTKSFILRRTPGVNGTSSLHCFKLTSSRK